MATTVYFASNRVLTGPPDDSRSYGPNIQPPSVPGGMMYGTAFVNGVDIGTDNAGQITQIEDVSQGGFSQQAIDDLSDPGRNLLVFVHGFNNIFSEAITRAAFNREWLTASGFSAVDTTVLTFSWPSLGKIASFPILPADYLHDQNMARLSGIHLMTFFANLEPILRAARANNRKTLLIAHSMGNLALQSAVENWFLHGNGNALLFDRVILAAGDCRDDTFNQPNLAGLSGITRLARRVSVYYSHADQILQLSTFVNGGAQRLGQDGPRNRSDQSVFPGAQYRMVDATGFRDYAFDPLSSHQYYRQSSLARKEIAADMAA